MYRHKRADLVCQKIVENLGDIAKEEKLLPSVAPALSVDGKLGRFPQLLDLLQISFDGSLVGREVDHAVNLRGDERKRIDLRSPTFAPNISRSTFQILRMSKSSSLSRVTPAAWVISRQWRGRSFDSFRRLKMANIFFACIWWYDA